MWENQTGEEEQCHQAVVNKANHHNPFKRKTQSTHNTLGITNYLINL
jgi:hypothetical protein